MQDSGCNESLASALDIAQSRIRTQSGQLNSEADTRYILIEPILSALGWDTMDTRSVRREYSPYPKNDKRHRRRLDYVLFVSDIPRIVVEADSRFPTAVISHFYSAVYRALWLRPRA